MRPNYIKTFLSALLLAGASHSALAQDASTSAKSESKSTKNDETVVVVTADRKSQNLQKYAGTAVVVDGKTLKETGAQNITDLEGRIPGLQILPNNNNIEVWIRGVGSSNNTELGDPAAGTHLDGVYIPRPAGFGSIFFDIDRVEVNIGPQGTLRGRNATAGTVNIIPWHPGLKVYDGYGEVSLGNYGQKNFEGMANIPFGDNMALRISAAHSDHGSYTKNIGPVTNVKLPERENNNAYRLQFLSKFNDQWDNLLSLDSVHETGGGTTGINYAAALGQGLDPSAIKSPRNVFAYPYSPKLDTNHDGLKDEINYHGTYFNAQLVVSSRHMFSDWKGAPPGQPNFPNALNIVNAGDSTGNIATDWSHYETQTLSNSQTQEFRLTAPRGANFDWTVGVFNFRETQKAFLGSVADQNAYFQGIEFNMPHVDGKSWAIYTDDTWHVSDRVRLTAGLRYTDDQKFRQGVAARYLFALGAGDYNCCMGPILGTPGFEFAGINRTNFTVPTLGSPNAAQQALDFYWAGIKSFGKNDTLPSIFPLGKIPTGRTGPCVPNPATPWLVCASDGLYNYETIDSGEFWSENAHMKSHFLDWRLRGEFDVTPNNLLYALVATGNKSGGFNDNIGTGGIAPTYRPERLTNYELGSKNRFTMWGFPARFNITAFYEDYHDQVLSSLLSINAIANFNIAQGRPVTLPSGFAAGAIIVNYNYNAANSVIAGSQIDGGISFPEQKIALNYTLLWLPEAKVVKSQTIEDFRFQSDIDSVGAGMRSIADKRLPRTPKIQFNAHFSQKFEMDGGTFDYVLAPGYRSNSYFTIFNGQDYVYDAYKAGQKILDSNGNLVTPNTTTYRGRLYDTIKGHWTLDIGGGYTTQDGKIRFEVYANNILNNDHATGILITQLNTVGFLPRPATYGARLRVAY